MSKKHIVVKGKNIHMHGWKADRPDHRDVQFSSSLKVSHLPDHTDLRSFCSPVKNQGQVGSCTANSSTSGMEFLAIKMGKPRITFSRLFLYYAERVKVEHGNPSDDSGAQIRDTMKSLATYGVCPETEWPYVESQFSVDPPTTAWADGLNHKIITYLRVTGLDALRACLASGYSVIGGFSVPESMESEECAKTGIVKYPEPHEKIVGGHAIHFVGYDDKTKLVTFQNSWGDDWGDKGFGYLDYKYFTMGLASDCWTLRSEEY